MLTRQFKTMAVLALCMSPGLTQAQPVGQHNRRVSGMYIVGADGQAPGLYEVSVAWHIELDAGGGPPTPLNLGTVLTVSVNSNPVASGTYTVTVTDSVDYLTPVGVLGLQDGDMVSAALSAAPESESEQNTGDDQISLAFHGPIIWDRLLKGVSFTPDPGGPANDYTVHIHGAVADYGMTIPFDLGMDVKLQVNGVEMASQNVAALGDPTDAAGPCCGTGMHCGSGCHVWNGVYGVCQTPSYQSCVCSRCWYDWFADVPGIILNANDQVTVIIIAAKGTLPERDAYNNSMTVPGPRNPADVNADGMVNGDDIQWFVSALMTP